MCKGPSAQDQDKPRESQSVAFDGAEREQEPPSADESTHAPTLSFDSRRPTSSCDLDVPPPTTPEVKPSADPPPTMPGPACASCHFQEQSCTHFNMPRTPEVMPAADPPLVMQGPACASCHYQEQPCVHFSSMPPPVIGADGVQYMPVAVPMEYVMQNGTLPQMVMMQTPSNGQMQADTNGQPLQQMPYLMNGQVMQAMHGMVPMQQSQNGQPLQGVHQHQHQSMQAVTYAAPMQTLSGIPPMQVAPVQNAPHSAPMWNQFHRPQCHYFRDAGGYDAGGRYVDAGTETPGLRGRVWTLSKDRFGTHQVQQAFEKATTLEEKLALIMEFKGHILEACKCPHANHALQKGIVALPASHIGWMPKEVMAKGKGAAVQVARHRYGCRVLERLIESCMEEQVTPLVNDVLLESMSLACHIYGNYVIQHLLEHGFPEVKQFLAQQLEEQALELAADTYATAVLAKALKHVSVEYRRRIATVLCSDTERLVTMACTRYGHATTKLAIQNASDEDYRRTCTELAALTTKLRGNRYGRLVANFVKQESAEEVSDFEESCEVGGVGDSEMQ